jgi:ubiquinone/menaquinone biosynthesis C-methylase UbiE
MMPFRKRRDDPYMLVVGMTGVRMGDRLVQVGCAHGGRLAAVAGKVGLSGRAVAVVPDQSCADRARKGAEQAGVLVEIEVAPSTRLPLKDDDFDLAVVDDTAPLLGAMRAEDRVQTVRELLRVLRPGGRVIVMAAGERGGLGALFSRAQSGPAFDPTASLEADGFRTVRKLAEREGLIFFEGTKPRTS